MEYAADVGGEAHGTLAEEDWGSWKCVSRLFIGGRPKTSRAQGSRHSSGEEIVSEAIITRTTKR